MLRHLERHPARSAGGHSLLEVLVAATLLAGVLLSVMLTFSYGSQRIHAARFETEATTIANDILEDIGSLHFRQTWELLEDNPADEDRHYTWSSDTGGPNAPEYQEWAELLSSWTERVEEGLPKGRIILTVRGLQGPGGTGTEVAFKEAEVVQVVVSVAWTERRQARSVCFARLRT